MGFFADNSQAAIDNAIALGKAEGFSKLTKEQQALILKAAEQMGSTGQQARNILGK